MAAKTRNISTLIESQLPGFIIEDYSKFKTFIEKYYEQQELRGQPLDIIHNITQYRNIDFYSKEILTEKSTLTSNIASNVTSIVVEDATSFPEKNGYIKIGNEICFYKERTNTEFLEVSRGVSGNNTLGDLYTKSEFVTTEASEHVTGDEVLNISNLFLYAFVKNFESEYLASFPEKFLRGEIDKRTLIKNIGDFYRAKGTDRSIQFLFKTIISANPDEAVSTYAPKDYTFKASTSDWQFNYTIRIVPISGDPQSLIGNVITQGGVTAVVDNVIDNTLIIAPDTINGEFEIASKTELKRAFRPTDGEGDKITVFSTQGFPQVGKLFIDNKEISYSKKTVNQFTIQKKDDTFVVYQPGTKVYSANPVSSGDVEFLIEGVVFNLLPKNPQPYASTGDKIEVGSNGFDTASPVIKNVDNEVRWLLNTTYVEPNSIHPQIQLDDVVADVSAIFEDDQYFYICSSSFPSDQILLTPSITQDLQDQELLKLIRKQPITTTEVYSTGNKDVGILVDGTPVYSNRSEEQITYGLIDSVSINNKGRGYKVPPIVLINEEPNKAFSVLSGETVGSIEITDTSVYEEDPAVRITSGEGARLSAVVTNGEITSIAIDNPGQYYSFPPRIIITDITGRGNFAEYEASVENGQIVDLVKVSGGKLYDARFTSVVAVANGSGATATAKVRRWTKDRYFLLNSLLDVNNSYVFQSKFNISYGYGVVANPKVLRRRLLDSINTVYEEQGPIQHSPIVGYAYDGNPIYGPYGYSNPLDSSSAISRLESGYRLKTSRPNGPTIIEFVLGTFVDDYEWVPSVNSEKTELDQNNGRFCVTPDYPDGVYAYFVTMDQDQTPQFPYILGENFYSIPVDSNYNSTISQKDIPKQVKRLNSPDFDGNGDGFVGRIKDVSAGNVKNVSVVSSAPTFEVGSELISEGNLVSSSVSSVKGKSVVGIESEQTKALEITTSSNVYLFADDIIVQQPQGATGKIVTSTVNRNNFILRDIQGQFNTTDLISSLTKVQRFVLDSSSTYTLGATVSLIDIEAQTVVATGEVLEETVSQNAVTVKVLSGTFVTGDEYFLKSSVLSDTSRSEVISVIDLSTDIPVFEINDSIAILETAEDHGVSVGDFIDIDINPDEATTETTYFVRKKIYQNFETIPVDHKSVITDTGIGSGDVINTGETYISGTYLDVELVFRDQDSARQGLGKPGDPFNARATIVVSGAGGAGSVSSVTVTTKGAGYRKGDIITFVESAPIINLDTNNPNRFAFVVDHVGFAEDNNNLYLSNLNNLSNGDFIQIGDEIVEVLGVNLALNFVNVSRGRKGTIPTNHYDGNEVIGEEIPFRLNQGYKFLGQESLTPTLEEYDVESGLTKISYDYADDIDQIRRVGQQTTFFDQSSPRKVIALRNVETASYKLELSKDDENNFTVNPSFDVLRYYKYRFDTSHFSMLDTFIDISPSVNLNILVDGKVTSNIAPGNPGSFTTIRFGFAPEIDQVDPERVSLRYDTFYYFIKASGVDTEDARLSIVRDPLSGRKKVTHKTNTKLVYDLDSIVEYDGSGDITYTTDSLSAFGEINTVDILNSSRSLLTVPLIVGANPRKDNRATLTPVVENGSIVNVLTDNAGSGYVSPKLIITGDGSGAKVRLTVLNGSIVGATVDDGGRGYTEASFNIIETDLVAYYESDNIGLPKNVDIIFGGLGFTNDYSTTPSFASSTILVLENADLFVPGLEITQPSTGAKAKLDGKYYRQGSNILKITDVEGEFVSGKEIEGFSDFKPVVKYVLSTDFVEEVKHYRESGAFASSKGKISESVNRLQDSYFYQDYSYVVESETPIDGWRDLILETTHPAGFELFGEVNVFTSAAGPMPEVAPSIESVGSLNVSIQALDSIVTKRQITQIVALVRDSNVVRGAGGISISDVNLSDTFFREVRLEPEFDGVLDLDTFKRTGTTQFSMFEVGSNQQIVPHNDVELLITLDGIIQEPGVAYTTVGNQIIFDEPPLGPRIAEGQEVDGQNFYGKSLKYASTDLNDQYLRKFQDISDQFDNIRSDFDLYYDDGSIAKTDENELLIVVIDGVKQRYGEAYEILRYEDPSTPDKIQFKSKPEVEDALYDSEDPREDSVLRNGQQCYIYTIGNYFTASVNKTLIPRQPKGPFTITNSIDGTVVNVPDSLYAIVFVNSILQIPEKSYTIFGSQLSFRTDLPFAREADGTLIPPTIELIYVYGRTVDQTLTLHEFEPDTYLRDVTIDLTGPEVWGDDFEYWYRTRKALREGERTELYAYDRSGIFEEWVIGRTFTVTNAPSEYIGSQLSYRVPLYNQPTNGYLITLNGGNLESDGTPVELSNIPVSPGNTYRFEVGDPSMLGVELGFDNVADPTSINVTSVGEAGVDAFAFVELIVFPEAVVGDQITYTNTAAPTNTGTLDIVNGPEGQYGTGLFVTDLSLNPQITGQFGVEDYGTGYQDGDIVETIGFDPVPGNPLPALGDNIEFQISIIAREYETAGGNEIPLGRVKSARGELGEISLRVEANQNWFDLSDKIFIVRNNYRFTTRDVQSYTIKANEFPTITTSEPQSVDGRNQLRRNTTYWLNGDRDDNAYYKRTKAFANLHPKDKIKIAGENKYREVLEIPRFAGKTQFNAGELITKDHYVDIQATSYNGPQLGQGLSIYAQIDENGTVTDLIWNKKVWNDEFTQIIQNTVFDYTQTPQIYFIPKTPAGGGARANVTFIKEVFSVNLEQGGYGYEEPPTVVVAKPYELIKDPNRKIDSLSYLNLDLKVSNTAITISSIVNILTAPEAGVSTFSTFLFLAVDNPISFQQITVQLPVDDVLVSANLNVGSQDTIYVIDSITDNIQIFTNFSRQEFLLVEQVQTVQDVEATFDDTRIITQYLVEADDFFLSASPQPSTRYALISGDFLIGDSILYVTNTDGFPDEGTLVVNFEKVEYLTKETDRFYITERGSKNTTEADHFIGDLVSLEPDFSISNAQADIDIIIEEITPPGVDPFFFFGAVRMAETAEREVITKVELESQPILANLVTNFDIFGNERAGVINYELVPKIFTKVADVNWQITRFFDVIGPEEVRAFISTDDVVQWIQPADQSVRLPDNSWSILEQEIYLHPINIGIESISIELQTGGIIVVPGIVNPVELFIFFDNDLTIDNTRTRVFEPRGSVTAAYYEQFSYPIFIRFEDARKAPFNVDIAQWIRTFEDDDVSFNFADFGSPVAGSVTDLFVDELQIRRFISTSFQEAASRPVTVSLPDGYLQITQIPVQLDPVEEIIRFIDERTAPLNVDVEMWIRTLPYEKAFDSVVTIDTEDQFVTVVEPDVVVTDALDTTTRIINILPTSIEFGNIPNDISNHWVRTLPYEKAFDSVVAIDTEDQIISRYLLEDVIFGALTTELEYARIIPVWTDFDNIPDVRMSDVVLQDNELILQPQIDPGLINIAPEFGFKKRIIENEELAEVTLTETEIVLIINPVEQILIEGVLTEVLGAEVVEIEEDAVVSTLQIVVDSVFLGATEFEYVNLKPIEPEVVAGSPFTVEDNNTFIIQPQVDADSVQEIKTIILIAGSKINGQEYFIDFGPQTSVVDSEFEVTKYVYLWSGGAEERDGEFPVDERGIPFLELATPFQGDELNAVFWMLREVIPQASAGETLGITKQISRFYPNQHYLIDDPLVLDESEGFYAVPAMPVNVSVEVFFTETVPGGSDNQPTQAPPQEIEERDATVQTVTLELTRDQTIEIDVQATIFQEIVVTPSESVGTFIGGSPIAVTLNLDSIPDEGSGEDPPIIVDVTVVTAFEPITTDIEIVHIVDSVELDVQATIFQEYIRFTPAGLESTYGTNDNLALASSDREVVTIVEVNADVSQPIFTEQSLIIVQRIVNGVADAIADELDSVYRRTTLGPNYEQFQSNAFVSNGSLKLNASIAQLLDDFEIQEFELREESSRRPNGDMFNLAIPSINEVGGTLQGNLLDTETTSITLNVGGNLADLAWPTSGTILIGDAVNGTLEQIEYTGISGNQLTGITRGVGGTTAQTHDATESYVRTIG